MVHILERVQEFDSADADSIANSIISSAVSETIDIEEKSDVAAGPQSSFTDLMVQAIEPDEISVDTFGDVAAGSTPDIASDDDLLLAEKELGLNEPTPEGEANA